MCGVFFGRLLISPTFGCRHNGCAAVPVGGIGVPASGFRVARRGITCVVRSRRSRGQLLVLTRVCWDELAVETAFRAMRGTGQPPGVLPPGKGWPDVLRRERMNAVSAVAVSETGRRGGRLARMALPTVIEITPQLDAVTLDSPKIESAQLA
jgi:hypothetical protein